MGSSKAIGFDSVSTRFVKSISKIDNELEQIMQKRGLQDIREAWSILQKRRRTRLLALLS